MMETGGPPSIEGRYNFTVVGRQVKGQVSAISDAVDRTIAQEELASTGIGTAPVVVAVDGERGTVLLADDAIAARAAVTAGPPGLVPAAAGRGGGGVPGGIVRGLPAHDRVGGAIRDGGQLRSGVGAAGSGGPFNENVQGVVGGAA